MALIDLTKPQGTGAGVAQNQALAETAKEIAELTGNARSAYRLAKDLERDEEMLREMIDKRMRLEDF
jgi:hypothetical protein